MLRHKSSSPFKNRETPLNSNFNAIASGCISNFNTYINDTDTNIEKEINTYLSIYSSTVRIEIEKCEEQHEV